MNPVGHVFLRGNGQDATVGWPTSPKLEELRNAWLQAPDLAAQKAIAAQIQLQAFADIPYIPLGQYFAPTAYQANLTGMLSGNPVFWNIKPELIAVRSRDCAARGRTTRSGCASHSAASAPRPGALRRRAGAPRPRGRPS